MLEFGVALFNKSLVAPNHIQKFAFCALACLRLPRFGVGGVGGVGGEINCNQLINPNS